MVPHWGALKRYVVFEMAPVILWLVWRITTCLLSEIVQEAKAEPISATEELKYVKKDVINRETVELVLFLKICINLTEQTN